MAKIDDILRLAVTRKASDIHFSSESPVMIRQHGDLVALDPKVYSNVELTELLMEIIDERDKKRFSENKNLDKSYSVPNCGNFRLNFFQSRRGIGAVIRWLPTRMPEIDDLGLPPVVKKLADLPKGLLLVTGPTGSGKSTTLAAIINYMNTNFAYHILTVEDPVEFVHPCKQSLINQREIGQSCLTFADALKYALREDPDVILVGEMRDQETIGLALTAAETGHLVLGTLHTRGAASSVDRIIESFPATERPLIRAMLAESLRAVISQILLKGKEGGRVAAYEIMVSNYAISNLIREGKTFQIQSILQTAKGEGMLQMEAHIRQLMAEGKVDPVDADSALSSMVRAKQDGGGATPTNPTAGAGQKVNLLSADADKNPNVRAEKKPKIGGPKGKDGSVKVDVASLKEKEFKEKEARERPPTLSSQAPKMPTSKVTAPTVAPAVAPTLAPAAAPKVAQQAPAMPTLKSLGDEPVEHTNSGGTNGGDRTVLGITVKKQAELAAASQAPSAAPTPVATSQAPAPAAPIASLADRMATNTGISLKSVNEGTRTSPTGAIAKPPTAMPPVTVAPVASVSPINAPINTPVSAAPRPAAPPVAAAAKPPMPAAPIAAPVAAAGPKPASPNFPKVNPLAAGASSVGIPPAAGMKPKPPPPNQVAGAPPAAAPTATASAAKIAVEVPKQVEELTRTMSDVPAKKVPNAARPLPGKKAG